MLISDFSTMSKENKDPSDTGIVSQLEIIGFIIIVLGMICVPAFLWQDSLNNTIGASQSFRYHPVIFPCCLAVIGFLIASLFLPRLLMEKKVPRWLAFLGLGIVLYASCFLAWGPLTNLFAGLPPKGWKRDLYSCLLSTRDFTTYWFNTFLLCLMLEGLHHWLRKPRLKNERSPGSGRKLLCRILSLVVFGLITYATYGINAFLNGKTLVPVWQLPWMGCILYLGIQILGLRCARAFWTDRYWIIL
jgi:hypothetical protein